MDERDYSSSGRDHTRGKHGEAKDKRGAKKFRRSRQRFQQNMELVKLVEIARGEEPEKTTLTPTKHDFANKNRSKLRIYSDSGPMLAPNGYEWIPSGSGRSGWRDRNNPKCWKLKKIGQK